MVAVYLTFATTTVTCLSSLEEDMLIESPCSSDVCRGSEIVFSDVNLVLMLLVALLDRG